MDVKSPLSYGHMSDRTYTANAATASDRKIASLSAWLKADKLIASLPAWLKACKLIASLSAWLKADKRFANLHKPACTDGKTYGR